MMLIDIATFSSTPAPQKVGVLCQINGRHGIVEYSEISEKARNLRNTQADGTPGALTYNAGNICNHYFSYDFLARACTEYRVCNSPHFFI